MSGSSRGSPIPRKSLPTRITELAFPIPRPHLIGVSVWPSSRSSFVVSVDNAMAASPARSFMNRPTSSAAACCASAALPPLPNSSTLLPSLSAPVIAADGIEVAVPLPEAVPVYLWYQSAWVDEQGRAHFHPDVYHWDETLGNALAGKMPLVTKEQQLAIRGRRSGASRQARPGY